MTRQRDTFFQRLIQSKLVIIFELILLIGLATAVGREMIRRHQIQTEIQSLEEQAAALEKKNVQLTELITMVSTPSYQEEQARLQLGLQKPGESVVAVLGADTDQAAASNTSISTTTSASAKQGSNPQRWLNYFLHINES